MVLGVLDKISAPLGLFPTPFSSPKVPLTQHNGHQPRTTISQAQSTLQLPFFFSQLFSYLFLTILYIRVVTVSISKIRKLRLGNYPRPTGRVVKQGPVLSWVSLSHVDYFHGTCTEGRGRGTITLRLLVPIRVEETLAVGCGLTPLMSSSRRGAWELRLQLLLAGRDPQPSVKSCSCSGWLPRAELMIMLQ